MERKDERFFEQKKKARKPGDWFKEEPAGEAGETWESLDDVDEAFMKRAIELARNGLGWTSPNPMVGAILVRDGEMIGEGWHHRAGDLHAEREALQACQGSAKGADLYVTLEPCCHTGKQPPCTEAILEAEIRRVIVGCLDPNPLVAGKGIALLQKAGVEVKTGVLENECRTLNRVFFHFITKKRPFVTMKFAMTLDGKIAAANGDSKWVTGKAARVRVHETRHQNRAIMVGVGTVLADDPMLDCRLPDCRNPIRIVCDTHLKTPLESRLVRSAKEIPLILCCGQSAVSRIQPYLDAGAQVWMLEEREKGVDLAELMDRLGECGIDSLLLEGGGILNWSMLEAGLVDHVQAYIAPKLIGGTGKTPLMGSGFGRMQDALGLQNIQLSWIGEDILLEGDLENSFVQASVAGEAREDD